jgi:hypothetical protein
MATVTATETNVSELTDMTAGSSSGQLQVVDDGQSKSAPEEEQAQGDAPDRGQPVQDPPVGGQNVAMAALVKAADPPEEPAPQRKTVEQSSNNEQRVPDASLESSQGARYVDLLMSRNIKNLTHQVVETCSIKRVCVQEEHFGRCAVRRRTGGGGLRQTDRQTDRLTDR